MILRSAANLITCAHLAAGFLALILVEQREYSWAAGVLVFAAICDSIDGVVARATRCDSEIGSELDSLADLVSFGIAPAMAIYLSTLNTLPVAGIGAALGFVLCGGWRLARFQVEVESRHRFVGLPIPPAGLIVIGLAVWHPPRIVAGTVVATLALMMVSRVPLPTLAELVSFALHGKRRAARGSASG